MRRGTLHRNSKVLVLVLKMDDRSAPKAEVLRGGSGGGTECLGREPVVTHHLDHLPIIDEGPSVDRSRPPPRFVTTGQCGVLEGFYFMFQVAAVS